MSRGGFRAGCGRPKGSGDRRLRARLRSPSVEEWRRFVLWRPEGDGILHITTISVTCAVADLPGVIRFGDRVYRRAIAGRSRAEREAARNPFYVRYIDDGPRRPGAINVLDLPEGPYGRTD